MPRIFRALASCSAANPISIRSAASANSAGTASTAAAITAGLVDQHVTGRERGAQRRPGGEGIGAAGILRCASVRVWWVTCAQWFAVDVAPADSPTPAVRACSATRSSSSATCADSLVSSASVAAVSSADIDQTEASADVESLVWMAATVRDTRCRGRVGDHRCHGSTQQRAPTFRGPKGACPQRPKVKVLGR